MLQSQISYDSELVHDKPFSLEKMQSLGSFFKEKTDEEFTLATAQKLNLCREYQGTLYPTIAGVLFSDNDLRDTLFPYAKVECALFRWKEAGMGFQVQFAKREPGSYPENKNTRGAAEEPNITRYGTATEGHWQIL